MLATKHCNDGGVEQQQWRSVAAGPVAAFVILPGSMVVESTAVGPGGAGIRHGVDQCQFCRLQLSVGLREICKG